MCGGACCTQEGSAGDTIHSQTHPYRGLNAFAVLTRPSPGHQCHAREITDGVARFSIAPGRCRSLLRVLAAAGFHRGRARAPRRIRHRRGSGKPRQPLCRRCRGGRNRPAVLLRHALLRAARGGQRRRQRRHRPARGLRHRRLRHLPRSRPGRRRRPLARQHQPGLVLDRTQLAQRAQRRLLALAVLGRAPRLALEPGPGSGRERGRAQHQPAGGGAHLSNKLPAALRGSVRRHARLQRRHPLPRPRQARRRPPATRWRPPTRIAVNRVFANFGKAIEAYERKLVDTAIRLSTATWRATTTALSPAAMRGAKLFVGTRLLQRVPLRSHLQRRQASTTPASPRSARRSRRTMRGA